jgi:pimeloyl-ACP methyl ester carboxylesterase
MPRLRENRLRIGRCQCRWRRIATSPSARTALVLPGGPGLSAGYLASWAARLAKDANINAVLIEYPVIGGRDSISAKDKLELLKDSLAALFKKFSKHGNPILIGHSFSCRLLLELLRTRDVRAEALILMNCPERFDEGREFARAAKRLHLPDPIDSEDRFVQFWRRILPLYFGVPAKPRWIRVLIRDTSWMKCAWLADSINGKLESFPKSALPPALFLSGGADRRFPQRNTAILRKMFPQSVHALIRRSGHFPMLEAEKESVREAGSFLGKVRRGVRQTRYRQHL